MVELFTARSGAPSLKVDGVALHSPYDPRREAERFVRETIGTERPSVVIVLGECVGHVAGAVARHVPGALILAAVYSPEIAAAVTLPGMAAWHPGSPVPLGEFLRGGVGELQVEGLKVIEWPPSARAFPEVSRAANEAVRQVVQELNGSFVTTVAAGRLWLRNCVANFVHVAEVVGGPLCAEERPVIIAAPGPSLEEALPILADVRPRAELWALPSSCAALLQAGLEPDLVVMTDPGFYAMHHLHFSAPSCALAMPLSAARGSWDLPHRPPVFLLEQPFLAEKAFLEAARISAAPVPPHGTVAATAIDLALASSTGPVIVAGLDLAARDLLFHVRPNAFDRLLHLQISRLQPHTSLSFHRSTALNAAPEPGSSLRLTPALRTYAGWFAAAAGGASGNGAGRLHRLLPSAVAVPSMSALDPAGARSLLLHYEPRRNRPPRAPARGYPSESERRRTAAAVLSGWQEEAGAARAAVAETREGWELKRFPRVVDVAYMVAPRRLVESLKQERMGNGQASRSAAVEALEETRGFLQLLAGKLLAGKLLTGKLLG